MQYGSLVQLFFDESEPVMNNLENMSPEDVKAWFIEHRDLYSNAKQEFNQILKDIYAIRDQDLEVDEKLLLLDKKADQLDAISMGREAAENTCKMTLGDSWDKLDQRSQKFLITALVIESTIDDADGDFAPAVIEMGRVFENEIQKKVFIEYIQNLSQMTPAVSDSNRFYGDIEAAVQEYKDQRTYFISAIKMMKYIGDLRFTREDNTRIFRKELRRLLNRKESNITELSNQRNVQSACDYIDVYRNGAAHPNTAERPNIFSKSRVQECKAETKDVLDYFLTNIGRVTQ